MSRPVFPLWGPQVAECCFERHLALCKRLERLCGDPSGASDKLRELSQVTQAVLDGKPVQEDVGSRDVDGSCVLAAGPPSESLWGPGDRELMRAMRADMLDLADKSHDCHPLPAILCCQVGCASHSVYLLVESIVIISYWSWVSYCLPVTAFPKGRFLVSIPLSALFARLSAWTLFRT